jgi:hypothetical protein
LSKSSTSISETFVNWIWCLTFIVYVHSGILLMIKVPENYELDSCVQFVMTTGVCDFGRDVYGGGGGGIEQEDGIEPVETFEGDGVGDGLTATYGPIVNRRQSVVQSSRILSYIDQHHLVIIQMIIINEPCVYCSRHECIRNALRVCSTTLHYALHCAPLNFRQCRTKTPCHIVPCERQSRVRWSA